MLEILKPHIRNVLINGITFDVLDSAYVEYSWWRQHWSRRDAYTCPRIRVSVLVKNPSRRQLKWSHSAVPNEPGTAVFVESTANGVNGQFYDLWKRPLKALTDMFQSSYLGLLTRRTSRMYLITLKITAEEEEIADKYDLTDAQLMFRRRKIAQNGADLFKQEYPAEPRKHS